MKRINVVIVLFLMLGWIGCSKDNEVANVVVVDIAGNYPKKELLLQDFMDVEYIPLETNDEFVTQGDVMAVGKEYILVKNWSNDGDIFIFERKTGKGLRKLNRRGQGAEEYTLINGIVLDEGKNELFVNCTPSKKILVYDLFGNFKRSLNYVRGAEFMDILNYDENSLICYDMSVYYNEGKSKEKPFYHMIISKKDGSVVKGIPIPFDIVKAPFVQKGGGIAVASVRPIIPYNGNWLLVETSTDTVYNYVSKENKLCPFLVKTPSENPEILLTMGAVTERYYFMQTIQKVFDFDKRRGFPTISVVYDKQENAVFDAIVRNGDFAKLQSVDMVSHPINSDEIAAFQTLAANKLVETYENNGLKGRVKEIAAGLNEESNPVVLLYKYKSLTEE